MTHTVMCFPPTCQLCLPEYARKNDDDDALDDDQTNVCVRESVMCVLHVLQRHLQLSRNLSVQLCVSED